MINLPILQEKFNDIFRYQVENNGTGTIIQRSVFWQEMFCHRIDDSETFRTFVKSDTPLLFITGMVGTGKSTFVRAMYEKEKLCTGIIIDFKGYSEEFRSDDEDAISIAIKRIVQESVHRLVNENVRYKVIKNLPNFQQLHYNPDISVSDIDQEEWNSPYILLRANLEIAIMAIQNLMFDQEIFKFICKNNIIPIPNADEYAKIIREKLEHNVNLVSEIIDMLDWRRILDLLRIIANQKLPFVLCFDNIDAVKFSKIQNHFLESIINIANRLNNTRSDGNLAQLNPQAIKIVLNVRDENVSRINLSAAGTKRSMQLILNEDCLPLGASYDTIHVRKGREFFYEIIEKRLSKVIDVYPTEGVFLQIVNLIRTQILDIEKKSLKKGDDFTAINELSNESVRLMLDLISDLTFDVYKLISDLEVQDCDFEKLNHIVKGKLIQFIYRFDSTKNVIERMSQNLRDEHVNDDYCCDFRLCLTYLHNINAISFGELKRNINLHYGISEVDLRDTIFYLYNTGNRESEIITIYQNSIISDSSAITDDARIKINLKGTNILGSIIKHIDFFGKITEFSHKKENKCLFELNPYEAYTYISTIYLFVEKSYQQHAKFLENVVFPSMNKLYGNKAFEVYSRYYCIGKSLYLERVSNSHINHIKNYIREVFRGESALLLLSKEARQSLHVYKPNNQIDEGILDDNFIKTIVTRSSYPKILKSIYEIIEKYEDIQKKVINLTRVISH